MAVIETKESNRDIPTRATSGLSMRISGGDVDPREPLIEINYHLARRILTEKQASYLPYRVRTAVAAQS
jgi:hypothetical protein